MVVQDPTVPRAGMLDKALRLSTFLEDKNELTLPGGPRVRAAAACFAIVQNHFGAIVYLISGGHPSPAFCLSRSVYEGYIRGAWLLHCASDEQVKSFLSGNEPSRGTKKLLIAELIGELEKQPEFDRGTLSAVRANGWSVLCDYAHVGGRLVMRWNGADGIGINFTAQEMDEVLKLSASFAALAAIGMCEFTNDHLQAMKILEEVKAFHWS